MFANHDISKDNLEMASSTLPQGRKKKQDPHMEVGMQIYLGDICLWGWKVEWMEEEMGL